MLLNLGGTLEPIDIRPRRILAGALHAAASRRASGKAGTSYFRSTVNGNSRSDLLDVNGDGFLDLVTAGACDVDASDCTTPASVPICSA